MSESDNNKYELNLGDNFGAATVKVNGLTFSTGGKDHATLQNKDVVIEIIDGRIFASGVRLIECKEGDGVELIPLNAGLEEEADVVQASAGGQGTIQPGCVLGEDFILARNLRRLRGWVVYNVTDDGIPQALEPKEKVPENFVDWFSGADHIKDLRKQGHTSVRFWTEEDCSAISCDFIRKGSVYNAYFEDINNKSAIICWGGEDLSSKGDLAILYSLSGRYKNSVDKANKDALVLATQDVPELARFVAPCNNM